MSKPAASETAPLYDDDIYVWAKQQAAMRRHLAHTDADLPGDLDLEGVASEIENVGRSELQAANSLLSEVIIHLVRAHADPASKAVGPCLGEALRLQMDARRAFTPGMRRLMNLDDIWTGSVRIATSKLLAYGVEYFPSPTTACPFTLDDLLSLNFDATAMLPRLRVLDEPTPRPTS